MSVDGHGRVRAVCVHSGGLLGELWTQLGEAAERLREIRRRRLEIRERLHGRGFWVDSTVYMTRKGPRRVYRTRWIEGGRKMCWGSRPEPTLEIPPWIRQRLLEELEGLEREEERILAALREALAALERGLCPPGGGRPRGDGHRGEGWHVLGRLAWRWLGRPVDASRQSTDVGEWRPKGWTPAMRRVYDAILAAEEGLTPREISVKTGVSLRHVYRVLKVLRGMGLVKKLYQLRRESVIDTRLKHHQLTEIAHRYVAVDQPCR